MKYFYVVCKLEKELAQYYPDKKNESEIKAHTICAKVNSFNMDLSGRCFAFISSYNDICIL